MWTLFKSLNPTIHDEESGCSVCHAELKDIDHLMVCTGCSIVHPSIDQNPEWRYYNEESQGSNPMRCGMPSNPLFGADSSFGCKILCEGKTSYQMRRLQRSTDWRNMTYRQRSLYDEFQHISVMASNAGIAKMIIDEACRIHKDISEKQTFRGINRDGIIAASIYIACRIKCVPRSARDIASIFKLDPSSATKGCKNAMTIMNSLNEGDDLVEYTNATPQTFVVRDCSKLGMTPELSRIAEFVAIQIEQKKLIPENTPQSIAAGIIYFVTQEFDCPVSQQDIRNVSKISQVTMNKCFKKIHALKERLIPPHILKR